MAGYIDIYDITAKLQHISIDSTSNPSSSEVGDMIDEIEAAMDARFAAAGISIPITLAAKILVVTPIAINGVCAEVLRAADVNPDMAAERQRLYDHAMANIEKHPEILRETSESFSVPAGSSGKPRFHRAQRDW